MMNLNALDSTRIFKIVQCQMWKKIVTCDDDIDEESECFGWSKNSSKAAWFKFKRKLSHLMMTLMRNLNALDGPRILQNCTDPDLKENCYM